jgi:hypothetical protein
MFTAQPYSHNKTDDKIFLSPFNVDCIGGVMISVFSLSEVHRGFDPRSVQAKDKYHHHLIKMQLYIAII